MVLKETVGPKAASPGGGGLETADPRMWCQGDHWP